MSKPAVTIPCDKCGQQPERHHIEMLSGKLPSLACKCPRSVHGDYGTTWRALSLRWNEYIESFDERAYQRHR